MKEVSVFLPCRKGSERVPKKNIKPFAGIKKGLIAIKLNQLVQVKAISNIVLSTNDEEILEYAKTLNNSKIKIHKRVESLSTSETSTDDLVNHALELVPAGHIMWTHVTSPFLNAQAYEAIIKKYFIKLDQGYDSLMTTNLIHGFLWKDVSPINYNRELEKWPRTQTLEPIHELNSGAFLASTCIYKDLQDRIGEKPYLYILDKIQGFDIDWKEDFEIAECLYKHFMHVKDKVYE
jgi:CMP-N-acetylneuraminic acid synthetase